MSNNKNKYSLKELMMFCRSEMEVNDISENFRKHVKDTYALHYLGMLSGDCLRYIEIFQRLGLHPNNLDNLEIKPEQLQDSPENFELMYNSMKERNELLGNIVVKALNCNCLNSSSDNEKSMTEIRSLVEDYLRLLP